MANIIQPSDFIGEIQIANVAQEDVAADLNVFITKYEPRFLKQLFGEDFYAVFIAGIAEQRFVDLIASEYFKPAIASYIYYWYIRDQVSQTVGVGNAEAKAANAKITNKGRKQVRAFNEMVSYVYKIIYYITSSGLYPEYIMPQWLLWRCSRAYWWRDSYYYYPYNFRMVPEIYTSINENNI